MADKPTAASVFALYANGGSDISEEDFGMVVRSLGRCATNEQLAAAGGGKKTLADVEKFVAGMPVTDTKAMVAQISSSFHAGIDGDNTGLVTEEMFRHILTNVGENLSDAEVTEAMAQFEVDAKGKISYEKAFGAIG